MSTTVDQAFITQFEADVHLAFQRMGSKFLNLVRRKEATGDTVRFPKLGSGEATTKGRHAEIVAMDLAHTYVEATMADYYAPEWLDKLDTLKTNIDERTDYAQSSAAACGRKADEVITTELDNATNSTAHGSTGMTKAKAYAAFEQFGDEDVPDDGQRYFAVSPQGWTDLLDISEFSNLDYISNDVFSGGMTQAKQWLGFTFFVHSGLPISSTTRSCFAWHRRAIGCGVNKEIETGIDWVPTRVSYLINSMISLGAKIIDNDGLRKIEITES